MKKVLHYTNLTGEEGPGHTHSQIRKALEALDIEYKYKYFPIENIPEFDQEAAKEIEKCDLYIGELGYSYSQLKKAKKLGAKTLLTRFSTHHLYQEQVLKDIYSLHHRKVFPNGIYNALKEYSKSDYFLVLSNFSKYTYSLYGIPAHKVFVVPLGVHVDKFPFFEVPPSNPFRVLFVGTNPIRKGLPILLKAWKELNIKGELTVRSGVTLPEVDGIRCITQWLSEEEVAKLYQRSSICVLPSLEDGFGATVLEAMACGTPVIITDVTGACDVVRDSRDGFIIPSGDVDELKKGIQFLYETPDEIQRMGKEARKTAEKYTWERFRLRVAEIVNSLNST